MFPPHALLSRYMFTKAVNLGTCASTLSATVLTTQCNILITQCNIFKTKGFYYCSETAK